MDFFFVGYIFFVFSDLWNNTSKNSLSNKTVHIDVLGNYYDVTTDEKGIASIKLDNITNNEDKPITVSYSFDEDNKYFASNGSVDVMHIGLILVLVMLLVLLLMVVILMLL